MVRRAQDVPPAQRTGPPGPSDRRRQRFLWLAVAVVFVLAAVQAARTLPTRDLPTGAIDATGPPPTLERKAGMIRIRAGRFTMGADRGADDARPVHPVTLDAFWMDEHEVTNAQFDRFVQATGHVTTAELAGRALVFDPRARQFRPVEGADWRHPAGPQTTVAWRGADPVVQVGWRDAQAYAAWAGKRLPTEAEWERAARAGLHQADYPWGRLPGPGDHDRANCWQGRFPFHNTAQDGYQGVAPVGSYPSNRFGLFDVAGNVAEWCADWYAQDHYQVSAPENPRGPDDGTQRVVRGGSWLSADNNGGHHRVWTRHKLPPGAGNNYTGFRCARDDL